jgi:hypothetical protein
MKLQRTAVVGLALALLWATAFSAQAHAALAATVARPLSVTSATWSVVISADPATTGTSGAPTAALGANSFWWITNNGTATLSPLFGLTIQITTTGGAAAQLEECAGGTWNTVADTCSGTVNVIAAPNATTAYVLPTAYPAGAALRLRLHVTAGGAGQTAVLSTQIRR